MKTHCNKCRRSRQVAATDSSLFTPRFQSRHALQELDAKRRTEVWQFTSSEKNANAEQHTSTFRPAPSANLFVSQRHQGIHASRSPRWNPARQQRDTRENCNYDDVCKRVGRTNADKQLRSGTSSGERRQ